MLFTWKTIPVNFKPRVDGPSNMAFYCCCLDSIVFTQGYTRAVHVTSQLFPNSGLLENSLLIPLQISSLLFSPFFCPSGNPIKCMLELFRLYSISPNYFFIFYITSSLWLFLLCYSLSVTTLGGTREGSIKARIHIPIFTKGLSNITVSVDLHHAIKHMTVKICL